MRRTQLAVSFLLGSLGICGGCLFPSLDKYEDGSGISSGQPASSSTGVSDPDCDVGDAFAVWPMDEGSGTTVRECKNHYNGTFSQSQSGLSWTIGHNGKAALAFDNGAIDLPQDVALQTVGSPPNVPFSITAWAKGAQSSYIKYFISRRSGFHDAWGFGVVPASAGKSSLGVRVYGDPMSDLDSDVFDNDGSQWFHAAVVYDGAAFTFYLNGAAVGKSPIDPSAYASGDAATRIGETVTNDNAFIGSLSDLRIYTRALMPAEVQAIASK